MKAQCENLKAYLDGELGLLNRLRMRIHLRSCAGCRADAPEFRRLAADIQQSGDKPVPTSLRDRVMADANGAASARAEAPASAAPRSRAKGVFTMKRALFASAFVIVLVAIGAGLFPRGRENAALADVARAMASVKSMHIVGWKLGGSGEKHRIEIWAKEGNKFRLEYGDIETAVDDGNRLVSLRTDPGYVSAMIRQSKEFPNLEEGMSYLQLFMGEQVLERLLRQGGLGIAGSRPATLPDGRKAVIVELRSGPSKALLTVGAESNLVLQVAGYDDDGTLFFKLEPCEYDVEIPDSVFDTSIPRNAVVIDQRVPVSEDRKKWREEMKEKLDESADATCTCNVSRGGSGTPYHSGLQFRCLSRDGLAVWYLPKRNTYYVLGKALVYDQNSGFRRVVEDREIRAPYECDYVPPPPPPPPTPEELKAEAMLELAKVPGAKSVFQAVRRAGGTCGSYHNGLRFHMFIKGKPVLIQYLPDRNVYRVTGKVEVYYPDGRTEVVENEDIEAPGPPDRE